MTAAARETARPALLYRTVEVEVRGIDEEKREAEFVATTESPVQTWRGPEVLRMSGARLRRFRKNPVVLDTHNHYGITSIAGSASEIKVDKARRRMTAVVRFARNARGEEAWGLVRDGHLRAMSIGYAVTRDKVLALAEGETDGDGDGLVRGPALVAREWHLYELSLVPLPADEDALRRSFFGDDPNPTTPTQEGRTVADPTPAAAAAPKPTVPEARSLEDHTPAEIEARDARAAADKAEAEARADETRAKQIRAMTPESLRELADEIVLEGVSVSEARKRLVAAYRERSKPAGTPEPVDAPPAGPRGSDTPTTNPKAADAALRALVGAKE